MSEAMLDCMVAGGRVPAELCVDSQIEQRCYCPKAPLAIAEVSGGNPSRRVSVQLPTLRTRAASYLRQVEGKRYAGPALRVYNERRQADVVEAVESRKPIPSVDEERGKARAVAVATVPSNQGAKHHELPKEAMNRDGGTNPAGEPKGVPTPVSFAGLENREEVIAKPRTCTDAAEEDRGGAAEVEPSPSRAKVCRIEGCETPKLRADNESGLCQRHFQHDYEKRRRDLVKVYAPAGAGLPEVRNLPHEYLVECVKEAQRRHSDFESVHMHGTGCCKSSLTEMV